jgi:cellulose biosynthesis protein BcsQ
MKKVIFFNHKGGVSKTTSAFHLGWKFTEFHKKVLIVDADPQCNLTALFLGDNFDSYYEEDATKSQNIMDGVRVVFDGKPRPIEAVECKTHMFNRNLFLLAGHMNLSEYDTQLNFAQTASNALSSLKSLPGAFNDLIQKTAEKYQIDYILIDLNPGLSAINQNLFMISDGFIIPTNPDIFSIMAIRNLSTILPRWVKWLKENRNSFSDSAYPLPETTPKFIGEFIQRFNIRKGKTAAPYQNNMNEIKSIVNTNLLPELERNSMTFFPIGIQHDYCLGEIPDFAGLNQRSQLYNVPVFALTDIQIQNDPRSKSDDYQPNNYVGNVLDRYKQQRDNINILFNEMANKIIATISNNELNTQ